MEELTDVDVSLSWEVKTLFPEEGDVCVLKKCCKKYQKKGKKRCKKCPNR